MLAQGAEWGRDLTLADSDRQSVWPFRIPSCRRSLRSSSRSASASGARGGRGGSTSRPQSDDRLFDYHSCIAEPLAAQIENGHRLALHNFRRGLRLARTQQLHDS